MLQWRIRSWMHRGAPHPSFPMQQVTCSNFSQKTSLGMGCLPVCDVHDVAFFFLWLIFFKALSFVFC